MAQTMFVIADFTSLGSSASAFFVITTLKNLSRDGRTVIASIHQPSSEVFDLFDNLFLLSHGQTIYFGEAAATNEVFFFSLCSWEKALSNLSCVCIAASDLEIRVLCPRFSTSQAELVTKLHNFHLNHSIFRLRDLHAPRFGIRPTTS